MCFATRAMAERPIVQHLRLCLKQGLVPSPATGTHAGGLALHSGGFVAAVKVPMSGVPIGEQRLDVAR